MADRSAVIWSPPARPSIWPALAGIAEQAVATRPGIVENWLALIGARLECHEIATAAALALQSIARFPDHPRLLYLSALAQHRMGAAVDAFAALERARTVQPLDEAAQLLWLDLASRLRTWKSADEALAVLDGSGLPAHAILDLYARSARRFGHWERISALCDTVLAGHPQSSSAVYFKALSLAHQGEAAKACDLIQPQRDVITMALAPPASYADAGQFHDALREQILADATLTSDPFGKATRQGQQTASLHAPSGALGALLTEIAKAVEAYIAAHPHLDPWSPYTRPALRLNAWAVIYGRDGYQISHHHPDGWLSGVFCVAGPPVSSGASLVLGTLDGSAENVVPPWPSLQVRPVPGEVTFFPSSMPHATTPSGSDIDRISVSFDVVAADVG